MLTRHIEALLRTSLTDFPAVLLIGARQVGKSTLAESLVKTRVLDAYVTLDDLATLEAARLDPDGFLTRLPRKVAIDEVQRVPDLMRALKRNTPFTHRWLAAYQTAYIERDIRGLTRLPDIVGFAKLLRLAGLRTANLLNVKNLATEAGLDQRTVNHYLGLFEVTFQMTRLLPWHSNAKKRLVKTPKLYSNDSAMACMLCGVDTAERLGTHPALGAIWETWAFGEIRKLAALATSIEVSYYRTHQGREVDFVLRKGNRLVGIEVKRSVSVSRNDFAGIQDFQEAAPHALGVVIYSGNEVVPFGKNLIAVPVRCLT